MRSNPFSSPIDSVCGDDGHKTGLGKMVDQLDFVEF